jgi:hypothetical protein
MKSGWIIHRGTAIFYVDFSNRGQDLDALKGEIEAMSSVVEQQPENSVLGLVDIRNTILSKEATALIKGSAPWLGPHIRKAAVVFSKVSGFKRVILSAIARAGGREVVPFDDIEEAKDWLVGDK